MCNYVRKKSLIKYTCKMAGELPLRTWNEQKKITYFLCFCLARCVNGVRTMHGIMYRWLIIITIMMQVYISLMTPRIYYTLLSHKYVHVRFMRSPQDVFLPYNLRNGHSNLRFFLWFLFGSRTRTAEAREMERARGRGRERTREEKQLRIIAVAFIFMAH